MLDRILHPDRLQAAWRQVRHNHGAAGGDHLSLARFEHRLELNLARLADRVRSGAYRPGTVRHVVVTIGAKVRRLTILSVADRVLQRAALDVLEPCFDRRFLDCSYGYRPGRGLTDAVRRVVALRGQGKVFVADADIVDCFPNIDHRTLLGMLDPRLPDPRLPRLFRQWIALDATHRAGRAIGLSLGAVVSPLLCNLYLHPLDRALAAHHLTSVRYADDFVVLGDSAAERDYAFEVVAKHLKALRLRLNPRKSRRTSFAEGFTFLGITFRGGECHCEVAGRHVTFARPDPDWQAPVPPGY